MVKGKSEGRNIDCSAGNVLIVPPLISDQKTDSSILKIKGEYFGTKKPAVLLEKISDGTIFKLKVIKDSLQMNPTTGESTINAFIGTKVTAGKYYLILDNKTGIGVDSSGNVPEIEIP